MVSVHRKDEKRRSILEPFFAVSGFVFATCHEATGSFQKETGSQASSGRVGGEMEG